MADEKREPSVSSSSTSSYEESQVDQEIRVRDKEAAKEKAIALKRRKTLHTYMLLGNMENIGGLFSSIAQRPKPQLKKQTMNRVLENLKI